MKDQGWLRLEKIKRITNDEFEIFESNYFKPLS